MKRAEGKSSWRPTPRPFAIAIAFSVMAMRCWFYSAGFLPLSSLSSIERAPDPQSRLDHHMRVTLRGGHGHMPQQILHRAISGTLSLHHLQKMCKDKVAGDRLWPDRLLFQRFTPSLGLFLIR